MEAGRSAAAGPPNAAGPGRTLAQTFCLITGIVLILVGVLGFIFGGTSFAAGSAVHGQDFIIFNVNGWHNVIHILSGVFLVAMAASPATAVTGAIAFGVVYVVVTIWGFIAGTSVLGIASINTADNILHLALAVLGFAIGLSGRELPGRAGPRERAA